MANNSVITAKWAAMAKVTLPVAGFPAGSGQVGDYGRYWRYRFNS